MRFHACSVTQLVVAAASYVYIVYSWYGRRVLCYVCIVQTGVNREYRNVNWVTMYVRASDKSCASHVTSLRHSGTISQRRGVLTPGTVHKPRHGTGYPDSVKSSLGNWGWGKGCEEGQTWDHKGVHAGSRKKCLLGCVVQYREGHFWARNTSLLNYTNRLLFSLEHCTTFANYTA